jgi:hypothetical protein
MIELKDVENAAKPWVPTQDNFETLDARVYKREPSKQNGSATTLIGPPTSGTFVLSQLWWDALGGLWVCTAGGTPGTWVQLDDAVVTAFPENAVDGYRVARSDENFKRYRYVFADDEWVTLGGSLGLLEVFRDSLLVLRAGHADELFKVQLPVPAGAPPAAPANASGVETYGVPDGFANDCFTHDIKVYAFKVYGSTTWYSETAVEAHLVDDCNGGNTYHIEWSWAAVAGADGYRVFKQDDVNGHTFNVYKDVVGTSFIENAVTVWTAGSLPQNPVLKTGLFVNNSVDIGVGTATPAAALHVKPRSDHSVFLRLDNIAGTSVVALRDHQQTGGTRGIVVLGPAAHSQVLPTDSGRLAIFDDSSFGATLSLHAVNAGQSPGLTIWNSLGQQGGFLGFVNSAGNYGVGTQVGDVSMGNTRNGRFVFALSNGGNPTIKVSFHQDGKLMLSGASGNLTPNFTLDVNGDIRVRSSNKLFFGGTGAADNDVNLYRGAADVLRTDDAFLASRLNALADGSSASVAVGRDGFNSGFFFSGASKDVSVAANGRVVATFLHNISGSSLGYLDFPSTAAGFSFHTTAAKGYLSNFEAPAANKFGFSKPGYIFLSFNTSTGHVNFENGLVGFGHSATPNFRLDVNGDIRLRDANKLYFGGTGAADNDCYLARKDAAVIESNSDIDLVLGKVLKIDGIQVVKDRIFGWTPASGTANRAGFDTATVTLEVLAEHVKALIDDLHDTGHGLIGT